MNAEKEERIKQLENLNRLLSNRDEKSRRLGFELLKSVEMPRDEEFLVWLKLFQTIEYNPELQNWCLERNLLTPFWGLKKVNLDYLNLNNIPSSLFQLVNIEKLNLWSNQVSIIPDEIRQLKNIKYLRACSGILYGFK